MQIKTTTFILFIFMSIVMNAGNRKGIPPEWLTKGVEVLNAKRSNNTYRFMAIHDSGKDLEALKSGRMKTLAAHIGATYKIHGTESSRLLSVSEGNHEKELVETYEMVYKTDMNSEKFYARLVDEYWKYSSAGIYEYHALFAVSEQGQTPLFDDFSVTSPNGAAPALMSIIPGVGQFYKGQKVKGLILFGAETACIIGALYCENQRSDNTKKMVTYPRQIKEFSDKASDWKTRRNILWGCAGAVWVYNMIDAIAVKGTPKVIVKPTRQTTISFTPFATPNYAGMTLTYNW